MSSSEIARQVVVVLLIGPALLSCGDDSNDLPPVDAAGTYLLAMTNRHNGCEFDDWEEGAQSSGVNLIVAQEDEVVTGEVQSVAGLFLLLVTGSTTFRGEATSGGIRMDIEGNIRIAPRDDTDCEFWVDAELAADLDEDTLDGTIAYTRRVAPGFTCPAESGCRTLQEFSGVRPPR